MVNTNVGVGAMKVLHLPELVGGEPTGLSKAMRAHGVDSTTLARHRHPFGYGADTFVNASPRTTRWSGVFRTVLALKYLFEPWDVVHFNFGSTLLDPGFLVPTIRKPSDVLLWLARRVAEIGQGIELLTLSLRGVKIFVHFQGSDARQNPPTELAAPVRNEANNSAARKSELRANRYKKRRIARFSKFAKKIYFVNPDLSVWLPSDAEFVPYASVDVETINPAPHRARGTELVIAHAPSNRLVKGTASLEAAVLDLRSQGFPISLQIVEGVQNKEVMRRLAEADVVVDQLVVGWYGALAVEAMALGKPVICYINEADLRAIDAAMRVELPIIGSSESSIQETLIQVLQLNDADLAELGEKSRSFSLKWHNPSNIAGKLLADYRLEGERRAVG